MGNPNLIELPIFSMYDLIFFENDCYDLYDYYDLKNTVKNSYFIFYTSYLSIHI